MTKKNEIIVTIIISLLLLIIIALLFYINITKEKTTTIKATVKNYSDGYIIAEDNKTKDKYILESDKTYNKNDIIEVTLENINNKSKLKTADVKKIKLLKKSTKEEKDPEIKEEKIYKNEESSNSNNNINNNTNNENKEVQQKNNDNINTNTKTNYTENDVVTYFQDTNNEVDKQATITSKIKTGFVTIVDFLFYGKEIKGYTFNQISTTTKLKLLKLALAIDTKIESKFPNYKNNLSEKYQKVKSKIIEKYLDITQKACSNNEDTCNSAKEGLRELKTNFKITWSFIKDISGVGLAKLKSWYEVWKDA